MCNTLSWKKNCVIVLIYFKSSPGGFNSYLFIFLTRATSDNIYKYEEKVKWEITKENK